MVRSRPSRGPRRPAPKPADRLFSRRLLAWYKVHHRRLPWRETDDPYATWISEVMLQQTTVPAVVPYYVRWLRLFPDAETLARAPLQKVLRAWQGLGYYERARNLHRAAALLVREHGGRVPDDEQALARLPGFGPYTTAAVLSLAYGRPLPVVDANVRRVLMRVTGLAGEASARHDRSLREYLSRIFPDRAPGPFNQAMMELGALVCRSRNPQCLLCPVRDYCRAFLDGTQEVIPRPRRRPARKVEAVLAVIRDGGRVLIQKRPDRGLFGGLWEFPGGKVEPGERTEDALRREVREELGVEAGDVLYLKTVGHAYTQFRVTLHVFSCVLKKGRPNLSPDRKWVAWSALPRYPMPSGSARVVRFLRALGREPSGRTG